MFKLKHNDFLEKKYLNYILVCAKATEFLLR